MARWLEMNKKFSFKLDWVLNNELAVGPAPLKKSHLEYLATKNIKSILNLCNEKEAPIDEGFKSVFNFIDALVKWLKSFKFSKPSSLIEINNVSEKYSLILSNSFTSSLGLKTLEKGMQ